MSFSGMSLRSMRLVSMNFAVLSLFGMSFSGMGLRSRSLFGMSLSRSSMVSGVRMRRVVRVKANEQEHQTHQRQRPGEQFHF